MSNTLLQLITKLEPEKRAVLAKLLRPEPEPIAIIGIGCRFPGGVNTPDAFWVFLKGGRDGIIEVPAERWDVDAFYDPDPTAPGKMYTRHGGFLPDVTLFDSEFFGISAREAMRMDPQQRLLLEVTWEALENAGQAVEWLAGSETGVFIGIVDNHYLIRQMMKEPSCIDDPYVAIGSAGSAASGRLSYMFDFRGPNVTIDTACSSSLVALHLACQSLRNKGCHLAVAGGVHAITIPQTLIASCKMRMLSADGRCKTFDARADGYGFGEGCGIVVLKQLKDALADGDNVIAIIRGSAVNEDGRSSSLTAPNGLAQQAVIRKALANAGVQTNMVSYVEAHGSGTSLGDPIEVEALQEVLNQGRAPENPLTIGTVKTNIGHLYTAAGISGVIKTVLSLQHQAIPLHLHLQHLNPNIAWDADRLRIPTELTPWTPIDGRRVAGVSSFGWSGTNAHVILEEAEAQHNSGRSRPWQLLLLSAKTISALDKATKNLSEHLQARPAKVLADVAYTLQVGRNAFDYRRMVVCQDIADAITALETLDPQRVLSSTLTQETRPVTFMFPGLGDQYMNMAAQLYKDEPVFRRHVDHCCELLQPYLGFDLHEVMYPRDGVQQANGSTSAGFDLRQMLGRVPQGSATDKLKQTSLTQPMVFVVEYALAQLWMSWGIKPHAMIGYSLGEYVAACLAGVFSLADGSRLVAQRAQMIETLPAGAMLAVNLPEDEVTTFLDDTLSLSAINGPMMCVVAGPPEAVARLEQQLITEGVACRQIQTSHAFHSKMMEPIMASLTELLQTIELKPPRIPYVSNVTGTWITSDQATDPNYWATHLRQPVRFARGVQTLWQKPGNILLEVGIGQTLGSLAMQHPARSEVADPIVLSSLPSTYDRQPDIALLLRSLGQLWLAGVPIDWSGFYAHEQRRRRPLPTYPFERQRYWPDYSNTSLATWPSTTVQEPIGTKKKDIADWFYVPTWQRMPLLNTSSKQPQQQFWLFFVDECGLGMSLVERLQQQGQDISVVMAGQSFQRVRDGVYTINPQARDDYIALIKHLYLVNKPPDQIVHMWSVTVKSDLLMSEEAVNEAQQLGFYSLLFLAQALGNQQATKPVHIRIVSNNMQDVLGGEGVYPEKATLLGPFRVIPKEYEQITCSSVDVVLPTPMEALTEQLLAELVTDVKGKVVAYRGQSRWVQSYEPIRLEDRDNGVACLRKEGVYLITGGFGGLGFALAECLAKTVQAKLVLVGRSSIPPRETWSALLADDTTDERVHRRIQQVLTLEALGAEVLPVAADVANQLQMQQVIDSIHEQLGDINGVFHMAGVPGEGLIQFKTPEAALEVLRPKLHGTLVLDAVLRDEALDFMVLYSSTNAIIGGLGEVDYCAANAFLDAFAHYNRAQRSIPTVSINWGPWQWDAWQSSLALSLPEVYEQAAQIRQVYGLSFDEGKKALWRILSTSLSQVLVLTLDLQAAFAQWHSLTSSDFLEKIYQNQNRSVYPRPNLRTPYVAPRDETEKRIAEIWAGSLAIEKVGIHDHFLELGGNSLLGVLIISRLKKELGVNLSAAALYEGPTVSALYEIIWPDQDEMTSLAAISERGKKRKELRKRRRKQRA